MPNLYLEREDFNGDVAPWRRRPVSPGGPSNPPVRTLTPVTPPPMSTPQPPAVRTAPPMSTPTPPVSAWNNPAPPMSNPLPPLQTTYNITTGGNQPPAQAPQGSPISLSAGAPPTLPTINGNQFVAQGTANPNTGDPAAMIRNLMNQFGAGNQPGASQIVQSAVNDILNQSNPYIQRARTRALDYAGERGLLNSSMAAGAAEGAAIDAAMPLIQESLGITNRREGENFAQRQAGFTGAMGLTSQREQQNFTGQQNQLDRVQGVNNALLTNQLAERQAQLADYYSRNQMVLDGQIRQRLQSDAVSQQDWLADRSFSREFNGALSMMPIRNAYDMANAIQKYALSDPEVYTPTVISGMTNFFQQNMMSILSQYFPNLVRTGG